MEQFKTRGGAKEGEEGSHLTINIAMNKSLPYSIHLT
jgi:hypothetical protein